MPVSSLFIASSSQVGQNVIATAAVQNAAITAPKLAGSVKASALVFDTPQTLDKEAF